VHERQQGVQSIALQVLAATLLWSKMVRGWLRLYQRVDDTYKSFHG